MIVLTRRMVAGHLVAAILVFAAAEAHAQSDKETACRRSMSKSLGRFVTTAFKDLVSCHNKRNAGRHPLSVNCNDVFSIPDGKAVRAYEKARIKMIDACPDTYGGVRAQFARCPSPHSNLDDDGATNDIDNFIEAVPCILNLAATLANGATARVLGGPDTLPTRDAARCYKTLGKAFRKRIDAIGKVRRECQYEADKAGTGLGYHCATFDDGRIAENLAALVEDITDDCGSVPQDELVPLGGCGQTAAQIIQCAGGISTVLGGGLVAEAYELPATCNLGFALLRVNAGLGLKRTATRFELGYNGLGQGVDLLDGFFLGANLSCNSDCVDCDVELNPLKGLPQSNCRCESDPTIHCDTLDGTDADDCGGGQCVCQFGPPLPLSTDGVPACVTNEFTEVEGTADGGTGVSTTTIPD